MATNTASTSWLVRSRRKLRNSLGENWVDESWSATNVRPSTSAMTVIIVPEIPISRVRASSAVPWNRNWSNHESGGTSIRLSTEPARQGQQHRDRGIGPERTLEVLANRLVPHADSSARRPFTDLRSHPATSLNVAPPHPRVNATSARPLVADE